MGTFNPSPERKPSESRVSQASAEHTGWRDKGKRPMFDTLAVTKELQESGLASPQAEAIVAAFGTIAGNVATKDDLGNFATKDDLRNFATKDDLGNFATKDDLRNFATKDDLRNFATKDDLRAIEEKMVTKDYLKDNLKYYATEASLQKAIGELRHEMQAGFLKMQTGFLEMQRFFIKAALGTITINIAMVSAIFVIAKYLM